MGALALLDDLDEDFLVMNGDVLTDINYKALLEHHSSDGAVATIATHAKEIQISLGVLGFDDAEDPNRLTQYYEKPKIDYEASMGVYCFSPEVIEHIEPGKRLDFPDLMLRLVERGKTVRAWRSTDFWLDIGRPDDYEEAQEAFERMRDRLIPPE